MFNSPKFVYFKFFLILASLLYFLFLPTLVAAHLSAASCMWPYVVQDLSNNNNNNNNNNDNKLNRITRHTQTHANQCRSTSSTSAPSPQLLPLLLLLLLLVLISCRQRSASCAGSGLFGFWLSLQRCFAI